MCAAGVAQDNISVVIVLLDATLRPKPSLLGTHIAPPPVHSNGRLNGVAAHCNGMHANGNGAVHRAAAGPPIQPLAPALPLTALGVSMLPAVVTRRTQHAANGANGNGVGPPAACGGVAAGQGYPAPPPPPPQQQQQPPPPPPPQSVAHGGGGSSTGRRPLHTSCNGERRSESDACDCERGVASSSSSSPHGGGAPHAQKPTRSVHMAAPPPPPQQQQHATLTTSPPQTPPPPPTPSKGAFPYGKDGVLLSASPPPPRAHAGLLHTHTHTRGRGDTHATAGLVRACAHALHGLSRSRSHSRSLTL